MVTKLISKKTNLLSKKDLINIFLLKDSFWCYGKKSQTSWFKQNIKKRDIHNLLFINSKLVGYTLLRKRTLFINKIKKKYLLLDTLILHKKYRKQKISNLIMSFNNKIVKKK